MKTKLYIIILLICNYYFIIGQTSVSQNFEGSGTYGYTGGTVNTEIARGGTKSLRIGREDISTSCGVTADDFEVIFDPVFLIGTSCPGVFTFYHSVRSSSGTGCGNGRGLDSREGFAVYVKLNGSATWTLLNSFSAFGDLDWNWSTPATNSSSQCGTSPFPNPFIYNVPVGSTSAQFKIITIGKNSSSGCSTFVTAATSATGSNYDRGDEGFFIDDVSFTTTSPCTLPIQLLDFYGVKNKSANELFWKVAQEDNIDYYILEKSNDGINFSELGILPPSHLNTSVLNYNFIDTSPFNDITYYRLKTKESNGSFTSYKIIALDEQEKGWSFIQYQESNNLHIDFKNAIPKNSSVELFDIAGKQLISESITNSQTKINTLNYANGIYFVKISTPYKNEFFKILISK